MPASEKVNKFAAKIALRELFWTERGASMWLDKIKKEGSDSDHQKYLELLLSSITPIVENLRASVVDLKDVLYVAELFDNYWQMRRNN